MTHEIKSLVQTIKYHIPGISCKMSAMLPRIEGGNWSKDQAHAYNKLALRMGRYARDEPQALSTIFVRELWDSIYMATAKAEFLNPKDGLHLNLQGKRILAEKWLMNAKYPSLDTPTRLHQYGVKTKTDRTTARSQRWPAIRDSRILAKRHNNHHWSNPYCQNMMSPRLTH